MARRALLLIAIIFAGYLALFVFPVIFDSSKYDYDWLKESETVSPVSTLAVYHFRSTSDSIGHAPYGNHVYLGSPREAKPNRGMTIIYAGYCQLNSVVWESEAMIELDFAQCDDDEHITVVRRILGIEIKIETNEST